jgi:hypothetical protein
MTMNRPDECIGLPFNQMVETKKRKKRKSQCTPNVIMYAHSRGLSHGLQDMRARSLLRLLGSMVLQQMQLLLYQFHHHK